MKEKVVQLIKRSDGFEATSVRVRLLLLLGQLERRGLEAVWGAPNVSAALHLSQVLPVLNGQVTKKRIKRMNSLTAFPFIA